MNKEKLLEENTTLLLLLGIAYLFSIGVRLYWPMYFSDNASMFYNGELMINTNDGYFFASAARDILEGIVVPGKQNLHAVESSWGFVMLTVYATKFSPFSLETIILYMPAVISSLVVIPILLTGRLMGHTLVGFFAALLGSIAWSYYNRTMVGYYDTDMFSVLLQFSIFYTLLYIVYKKEFKGVLLSALLMFVYPLFYPQGMTIVYAMFIIFILYLLAEKKNIIFVEETNDFQQNDFPLYKSVILLAIPLMTTLPIEFTIILFVISFVVLFTLKLDEKQLFYIAVIFFIGFLFYANVFNIMFSKVMGYLDRGVVSEGLHFYQVIQTVREAGAIPFSTMANRISGSQVGLIISLIGYIVLVVRHKPFVIALPLIGVGVLSLWAGLRFTVYAVPVAAISAIYLFHVITTKISNKKSIYLVAMTLLTASMLYPNITHVIGYKVPTVLNKAEVEDLVKLDAISDTKDYTISWWDYGYPIWWYSNTNTLIDGAKHTNDNFIISQIMQATSPELVVNLSRLAIESYVKFNPPAVADLIFKNKKEDQLDPNMLLSELEDEAYPLPEKTRDIYLYLPYRMLSIFPTVAVFGNLDLTTGKAKRKITFYPTQAIGNKEGMITFRNGIVFDSKKGEVILGSDRKRVKNFIITQNTEEGRVQLQSQVYHLDGEYVLVYMKSYNTFILMDNETFKSAYVQMFILEKYDKNLFELVVSSPYSKIYKLKR